ncbi:MAG: type II CAAX prenyl endopeptidase Rce1 family protein [Promethearchaeota archaeon]
MKNSEKIYVGLIATGLICHILFLPYYPDSMTMIMNWIIIPFYSILGYLGLRLFEKDAGFPDMLEEEINNVQRLLIPLILGVIFAIGAIIFDMLNPYKVPRLPLPISIPYWIFVAIFDEFFWRLFLLTFLIYLISRIFKDDEKQEKIFWSIVIVEAVLYTLLQTIMFIQNVGPITTVLLVQIILIGGGFTVVACYCYRKGGFLAVMVLRLTQYMLYHVLYGGIALMIP